MTLRRHKLTFICYVVPGILKYYALDTTVNYYGIKLKIDKRQPEVLRSSSSGNRYNLCGYREETNRNVGAQIDFK